LVNKYSKQKIRNVNKQLPEIAVTSIGEGQSTDDNLGLIRQARENERLYREMANSVRDAIILINDEAKVTFWNSAAERIFGYSSSEATGKIF
jgi:PAS domain-containing protein